MQRQLSSMARILLGTTTASLTFGLQAPAFAQQTAERTLEEVVVTAQKRAERLIDVPLAMTSVNTDAVVTTGGAKFEDYFRSVPGLQLNHSDGSGLVMPAIRGIVTGTVANPTVGVTIDDVPTGASTLLAGGATRTADIDPGDLQRVEVLRGPQGTLYGASSMGGLIKYVTIDPSTTDLSGSVSGQMSDIHGGSMGYGARAAVNIPLMDGALGARISGSYRREGGYVDDDIQGLNDVNEEDAYSIRTSVLANIGEATVKVAGLYQQNESKGAGIIDVDYYTRPRFGDLINRFIPGTGMSTAEVTFLSGSINVPLGAGFELDSISGYGINDHTFKRDNPFGRSAAQAFFGVTGAIWNPQAFETEKFTQEIRLTSDQDKVISGLIGGFYTHEKSRMQLLGQAVNPATGAFVGTYLDQRPTSTFDEYAAFGSLTWKITDSFDIEVGGRYAENEQDYVETSAGVSVPGGSRTVTAVAKDNAFTYSISPRFKLDPDNMIYARLATGYRVGGPNVGAAVGVPPQYASDETVNYEIGAKGILFDRALTYDLALYQVDWKNFQLTEVISINNVVQTFIANRGQAGSRGVEFAFNWKTPVEGLRIGVTGMIGETYLKEDLVRVGTGVWALKGAPLLNAPEFAGTLSIDQDIVLPNDMTLFLGGVVAYTGDRFSTFARGAPETGNVRQKFDDYTTLDLRGGVRVGNDWMVTAFCNNVLDDRGVINSFFHSVPATLTSDYYSNIVQPRTIGLTVEKRF